MRRCLRRQEAYRFCVGVRGSARRYDCTYFHVGYDVDDEAGRVGVRLHSLDEPLHHHANADLSHVSTSQVVHLHRRIFIIQGVANKTISP